jgi:hypothetical protein
MPSVKHIGYYYYIKPEKDYPYNSETT